MPLSTEVTRSNPNATNSAKSARREKRNMQKRKWKNRGTSQPSQDQPYSNMLGPNDTMTSFATIPDITITLASPGKPSPLAPPTASNLDPGHLTAPTISPRRKKRELRLTRRLRPKANLLPISKRCLTPAEAWHRSSSFGRLHKEISRHESDVILTEDHISYYIARDASEIASCQPKGLAERLAKARAVVVSDRAALAKVWYARHRRTMTDKEKGQSEKMITLSHESFLLKKAMNECRAAKHLYIEAGFARLALRYSEFRKSKKTVDEEISQLKKELGFAVEDCDMPDDPASGLFSTKMLDESWWSREEKLACARHYVAEWEAELRLWEGRVSASGGSDQEVVRQSIGKAYINLEHFRSKVDEFLESKGEREEKGSVGEVEMEDWLRNPTEMDEGFLLNTQMSGGEDNMEVQPKNSAEMDGELAELVERVERL
ncbi:MAG: hypothetical protein LQ347_003089 [Umbilicaria vellea]|nr:MAG: hypothetical protein LQ347_003089 [Umbilicaria vellea]